MNRILAKRMKENIYYQYDSSQLPEISLADTAVIEPPYIHKRRMPVEYIIYLVRQCADRVCAESLYRDSCACDLCMCAVGRFD